MVSMSIFNLHSTVVEDYRDFVRSFFSVADDRAREFIDHELLDEARLWPEALLQVSPSYARFAAVDDLDTWFARTYGLTRDELRYILDPADVHGPDFPDETFGVLKEKEQAKYGEYRTRRLVQEGWDKLPPREQ
jgi:hypothetical protein